MISKRVQQQTSNIFPRTPLAPGKMKIGLLGGSFNPPHEGHLHISLVALKRLQLDRVWWIVSPGNPLKSHDELAPLSHRLSLCKQIAKHPRIDITDFEQIRRSPFTSQTLKYLLQRYPQAHFVWLMGADNLQSFHKWKNWRDIAESVPLAVIDRPSYRYRGTSSRFASVMSDSLICEEKLTALPLKSPPAWSLINARLCSISSTDIRKNSKNND